jgi:hypothetical protein
MKSYKRNSKGAWVLYRPKVTIKNTTSIPNDVIRAAIQFTRPPGISGFKVTVCQSVYDYCGWGCASGVKLRLGVNYQYPRKLRVYQYGQFKGRKYYAYSFVEALIYLTAHELMHVRQGQKGPMRRRVWGARGRFSEIETEAWAIRKLREYRRLS